MKNKMLLIGCLLLFGACAIKAEGQTIKPLSCYLPEHSNVSYSSVIELPVESPEYVISYGDDSLQFGELWLPDSVVDMPPPLVVLIHGGCWLNEYDIKHTHALSTALAQSGYAVWALEYRRTGDEGGAWPGSYNDVKKGIDYVPSLAEFGIDLSSVVLVGHSAGGHLALLAGAEYEEAVSAVIGLAAISDIAAYAKGSNSCQAATPKFMGGTPEDKAGEYALANPRTISLHENTVLLHGSLDKIVPITQSKQQADAQFISVEGAGHFDMIHPGTPAYQQLLKALAEAFQ